MNITPVIKERVARLRAEVGGEMKILHWLNTKTGDSGHGEPLDDATAQAWLQHIENKDGMAHWLEAAEPATEESMYIVVAIACDEVDSLDLGVAYLCALQDHDATKKQFPDSLKSLFDQPGGRMHDETKRAFMEYVEQRMVADPPIVTGGNEGGCC